MNFIVPETFDFNALRYWREVCLIEAEKKWAITAEEKGYEIPFTKHFYVYQPLREQAKVVNEMAELESENLLLMSELGITL